jgi:hypothetical protein
MSEIQGVCPSCDWKSLFVGAGGYITCGHIGCRNPCAPSEALGVKFPDYGEKAPSSPVETTGGSEQRPDHTGVIRDADEADVPCPDSCGGQSWTRVGTSRGGRWRCDTCRRIVPLFISDAIQAADDRRAL